MARSFPSWTMSTEEFDLGSDITDFMLKTSLHWKSTPMELTPSPKESKKAERKLSTESLKKEWVLEQNRTEQNNRCSKVWSNTCWRQRKGSHLHWLRSFVTTPWILAPALLFVARVLFLSSSTGCLLGWQIWGGFVHLFDFKNGIPPWERGKMLLCQVCFWTFNELWNSKGSLRGFQRLQLQGVRNSNISHNASGHSVNMKPWAGGRAEMIQKSRTTQNLLFPGVSENVALLSNSDTQHSTFFSVVTGTV